MKNSPAVGQCVRTHEGQHMPSDVTCEPPEIQSQNRVVNCEVPWSSPSYYLVQHPVNIKKKKKHHWIMKKNLCWQIQPHTHTHKSMQLHTTWNISWTIQATQSSVRDVSEGPIFTKSPIVLALNPWENPQITVDLQFTVRALLKP